MSNSHVRGAGSRTSMPFDATPPGAAQRWLQPAALISIGLGAGFAPGAQAATFTVTNLADAGAGSLRQAITDANTAAGADIIQFQAGLTGTVTLATGQLEITDTVTIQGPGAAILAVSGNNASRVFYLYNGSATVDVTISGLTVRGGAANLGAGIVNFDENLTLDGVVVTGNAATGDGGGIWSDGFSHTLTLRNSTVSGNTAGDDGGGIYVEDTNSTAQLGVLIQDSVISGNNATGAGGGIYLYDPDSDVRIERTTISGNTAGTLGGGIYFYSADRGSVFISDSTISGNSADVGGGAYLYGVDRPFDIVNTTVSGNTATTGAAGGIAFSDVSGGPTIRHSTIAGNTAVDAGGNLAVLSGGAGTSAPRTKPDKGENKPPRDAGRGATGGVFLRHVLVADSAAPGSVDLAGTFDVQFSLIETPGTATIVAPVGNVTGVDPQLAALANNGGPTQTRLPAATSPAVNAGNAAFAPPPATDQRGLPRVANGRIDIGSVERAPNGGTVQFTLASATVAETAGSVTLTVGRAGGTDAATVAFATANGTATAPADYASTSGTLTWAQGDATSRTIVIPIVADAVAEPAETFTVVLSNPSGGTTVGANAVATVTIQATSTAAVAIPSTGDWARALLASLMGLFGLAWLRRRSRKPSH